MGNHSDGAKCQGFGARRDRPSASPAEDTAAGESSVSNACAGFCAKGPWSDNSRSQRPRDEERSVALAFITHEHAASDPWNQNGNNKEGSWTEEETLPLLLHRVPVFKAPDAHERRSPKPISVYLNAHYLSQPMVERSNKSASLLFVLAVV